MPFQSSFHPCPCVRWRLTGAGSLLSRTISPLPIPVVDVYGEIKKHLSPPVSTRLPIESHEIWTGKSTSCAEICARRKQSSLCHSAFLSRWSMVMLCLLVPVPSCITAFGPAFNCALHFRNDGTLPVRYSHRQTTANHRPERGYYILRRDRSS